MVWTFPRWCSYYFERTFQYICCVIIRLVTIFTVAVIIMRTCSLYVAKFDAPISEIFTDAAGSATKATGGNIHFNFVNEYWIVRLWQRTYLIWEGARLFSPVQFTKIQPVSGLPWLVRGLCLPVDDLIMELLWSKAKISKLVSEILS